MYEDFETPFVDSVSSHHVTGLRMVLLRFTKNESDSYVGSRTNTRNEVKGIVTIRFQLEEGGLMEIEHMLFVIELRVNLLLQSSFKDGGNGITFHKGQVFVSSVEDTQDLVVVLGVRDGRLYKFLNRPMVGYIGYLDVESKFDSCEYLFGTARLGSP